MIRPLFVMYYLYILYSEKYDRYYVGQTNDPERRLEEHNSALKNSYTAKYRPWKMVGKFEIGPSLGVGKKIEFPPLLFFNFLFDIRVGNYYVKDGRETTLSPLLFFGWNCFCTFRSQSNGRFIVSAA